MGHRIREVSEHLDCLPMLPGVVTRLLTLNREDNEYFEKLLALAQQDPAFALRIIRLVSSRRIQMLRSVDDLQTAVTRIGTYRVAALITSLAVMEIFVPNEQDARNLWLHSIQVAITARNLARKHPSVDLSETCLCGLMHDIGRLVLFNVATGDVRSIDETGWETPRRATARCWDCVSDEIVRRQGHPLPDLPHPRSRRRSRRRYGNRPHHPRSAFLGVSRHPVRRLTMITRDGTCGCQRRPGYIGRFSDHAAILKPPLPF